MDQPSPQGSFLRQVVPTVDIDALLLEVSFEGVFVFQIRASSFSMARHQLRE